MTSMTTKTSQSTNDSPSDTDSRSGIAEIKRDAHAVKEDLEELKDDTSQLASHATSQALDAVKCGAESATKLASSGGQMLRDYQCAMNKQVRARPTASVLLALGAGVMIGRVLAATKR